MPMHEVTERTVVKDADGVEKTLLPGRITSTEAELYGLTTARTTDADTSKAETPERPAKSRKRA